MQKHLEFQIVTPRTLADFKGQTLVLPDVRVIGDSEKSWLKSFAESGKRLVITGTDVTGIGSMQNVVRFPVDPGKAYNAALEKDFEQASPDSQQAFFDSLHGPAVQLYEKLSGSNIVHVKAGPHVATSIARTSDGHINCFFANFAGLVGGSNPVQTPEDGVEVSVSVVSKSQGKGHFLPFMGETQEVKGTRSGDALVFALPQITKGAVFWYEP